MSYGPREQGPVPKTKAPGWHTSGVRGILSFRYPAVSQGSTAGYRLPSLRDGADFRIGDRSLVLPLHRGPDPSQAEGHDPALSCLASNR